MKRIISMLLCIVIVISMCACSGQNESVSNYHDEDGNFIIESEGHRTVMPKEIPFGLPYNGNTVTLSDVRFYEICVEYSYMFFTVVTLDVSQLDEASLHWLRESDLDVSAFITNEKNDYDFDLAPALGNVLFTDSNELVFVFVSSLLKVNRKSFAGSEISVVIKAAQEEKFEYVDSDGKTKKVNKIEEIHYSTTTGDSIEDVKNIDDNLYAYILEWLNEMVDSIF